MAIDELREHHLAGRLDVDTFEERVARAHAAVTVRELAELLLDLPAKTLPARREPETVEVTVGVPKMPGVARFTERKLIREPLPEVMRQIEETVEPALSRHGYTLEHASGGSYVFVSRFRPAWTYWAAILGFPIGLIALMHQVERRIDVRIRERRSGNVMLIAHGEAPLSIRQAFARMAD